MADARSLSVYDFKLIASLSNNCCRDVTKKISTGDVKSYVMNKKIVICHR